LLLATLTAGIRPLKGRLRRHARVEPDTQPGQVNGQGVIAFGAKWFAMSPTGTAIRTQPSSTAYNGIYQPTATT
jgi:hypothetical protein